jgi:hypothetical protein
MKPMVRIACALALVAGPALAEGPTFTGVWDTSDGSFQVMTLHQGPRGHVEGTYTFRDGRVDGRAEGRSFDGIWVQSNSGQRCEAERMHSHYWGRLVMRHEGGKFTGAWGYCNEGANRQFNGRRRGGGHRDNY